MVSNHVREKIFPHLLPRAFISDLSWIAGWLTSRHIGRGDQDPVDPAVGRRCRTTTRATADHRRRLSRPSPLRPIASAVINYNEEEEGRDDRIVVHRGQTKEGVVDPPDDCNLLASRTHPSSSSWMPMSSREGHTPPAPSRMTTRGGRTVTIVAASTTTKTTSGRGATTMADAAAPPTRTQTKTACHRRRTAPTLSLIRSSEQGARRRHPPLPFAGPVDDDRSRQRTGDEEKVSR